MMQRIVLGADASLADLDEPEITVSYADRPTRSLQATIPLGDPRRPLDDAQLLAIRSLADDVIGSDAAFTLTHAACRCEECVDVKALERLLVARDSWGSEISVT